MESWIASVWSSVRVALEEAVKRTSVCMVTVSAGVGECVGAGLGGHGGDDEAVGNNVDAGNDGFIDGADVGCRFGGGVGGPDGRIVGSCAGSCVGGGVGSRVGRCEGSGAGASVGGGVGTADGSDDGMGDGAEVGSGVTMIRSRAVVVLLPSARGILTRLVH